MRKDNFLSFEVCGWEEGYCNENINFCKYELFRKNWKFMYLFKVSIGKCNIGFLMLVFMLIIYKIDD